MFIQIGVKGQSRNDCSSYTESSGCWSLSQLCLPKEGTEQFIAGPTQRDKQSHSLVPFLFGDGRLGLGMEILVVRFKQGKYEGAEPGRDINSDGFSPDLAEHSFLPTTPSIEAEAGGELP